MIRYLHYREPFLRNVGLGLLALAVLTCLSQLLGRWLGLPAFVIFPVVLGVVAVVATAIWIRSA